MTLVGALTVEKQEVSIASANISKVYDGNTQISSSSRASNVTLSGVISGDTISVQGVIGNFTDKNAGTNKSYNISLTGNLTGTDSENYYINTSSIYTGANGVIQKLNITSVSNIAISNKIILFKLLVPIRVQLTLLLKH